MVPDASEMPVVPTPILTACRRHFERLIRGMSHAKALIYCVLQNTFSAVIHSVSLYCSLLQKTAIGKISNGARQSIFVTLTI